MSALNENASCLLENTLAQAALEKITISQVFESQVEKTPDHIALIHDGKNLTYQELNEQANQLAAIIRNVYSDEFDQPISKDTLIGLYFDRSFTMVISILAVLKTGAAYVPISTEFPKERSLFIIQDTQIALAITEQKNEEKLNQWISSVQASTKVLNAEKKYCEKEQQVTPTLPHSSNGLAYVIYTSGTSGKPKGVMIEQRSVINLIKSQNQVLTLSSDEVVLWMQEYVFDASVELLFVTLLNGGTLIIPSYQEIQSLDSIKDYIKTFQVTLFSASPSYLMSFGRPEKNNSIRKVITGGEQCSEEIKEIWQEKLINEYGPTEATVTATTFRNTPQLSGVNCIGKPLKNVELYILTKTMTPVTEGDVGEIYIGGAGVARGYLNRPELTEEVFLPNPFVSEEARVNGYGRMYKTGDLARWLPDGSIEFIGRNDSQVKIRGFRIELGEIESAINKLPNVKLAVVIDVEWNSHKHLVAYVTPVEGLAFDAEAIRTRLESTLPEYMIPQCFMSIESIPLTINGKLDRNALPEPIFNKNSPYVAPRNELESKLCLIWQQTLGLEQVGIDDNFFQIGGDSIVSIQLVSKLRQQDFNLQVTTIYDAPTVAQLAIALTNHVTEIDIVAEQGLLEGEFDLLAIQQSFFDEGFAKPNHWNQAFMLTIPDSVSESNIQQVLIELVKQHDVLRSRFIKNANGIKQRYSSDADECFSVLKSQDISLLSDVELQILLTDWQSAFHCFDGPLWQAALLTGYRDGVNRLFFAAHHLIIDTVSWRIISDDIQQLLSGNELAKKTSSYRQWVNCLQNYTLENIEEINYWQGVTVDTPVLDKADETHFQQLKISKNLTKTLLQQANQGFYTEINDLLLSALAVALEETFQNKANSIILEGHGREAIDPSIDISHTVGWFTAAYPVQLSAEDDLADTIIYTKEMLRAIPNKGVGYGAFYHQGKLTGARAPVIFNYLGQFDNQSKQDKEKDQALWLLNSSDCGDMAGDENVEDFLLNIRGSITNGELSFDVISQLSPQLTNGFSLALETALSAVIHLVQDVAQKGGIHTPVDFPVDISLTQLRELQQKYAIQAIFPANSLQQGFIYHHINHPSDDAYIVQQRIDYQGDVEFEHYQQAWQLTSQHYPALRAAFNWQGNEIIQVITKGASVSANNFIYRDISQLTQAQREVAISEHIFEDRKTSFDLEKSGLIRFTFFKQSDNLFTVLKSVHHCLGDGWSGPLLNNTAHQYYDALIQEQTPQVTEEATYLNAQAYYLQHKADAEAYWTEEKQGFLAVNDLNLMLDKSSSLTENIVSNPTENNVSITGPDYQQLKTASQNLGITLSAVIQFAWHKLIQIYTQDEQTIVGTIVSGRDIAVDGIEESVGLYINTLPLAVNWLESSSVKDILNQIQQKISQLNSHSIVSLGDLQINGEALFHSLVDFESQSNELNFNAETDSLDSNSLSHNATVHATIEKVDYPISILVNDQASEQTLQLKLCSGEDLLSIEQSQRLLFQLNQLIEIVVFSPELEHQNIELVEGHERDQLLHLFNNSESTFPENKTLHQLFSEQVENTPEASALIFDSEQMTYRELNDKAERLAFKLRAAYQAKTNNQVQPDTLFALYLDRSFEMVISILAVLKAGGAYVPISPDYPQARIDFIFEDTQVPLVISQHHYQAKLAECQPDIAVLLVDEPSANEEASPNGQTQSSSLSQKITQFEQNSNDLAYVIYTSGTTGQPKGVTIEHKSVVNLIVSQQKALNINSDDVVLWMQEYVFDASVEILFLALLSGGSLVIPTTEDIQSVDKIKDQIKAFQVSLFTASPSYLASFGEVDENTSIRLVITGGESCRPELKRIWQDKLVNEYGPTETTVTPIRCINLSSFPEPDRIGSPIDNVKAYVLSSRLKLVPIGIQGELYIAGAGLARGYLNRAELTDERFIANPFATEEDIAKGYTRLYKTGDLVRWLPDGALEFIGRNDAQVKIRGYRVELGEIEHTLAEMAAIQHAVVIVHDDHENPYLAAYIVPTDINDKTTDANQISDLDVNSIRDFITAKLPHYMVPSTFTVLDSIPLTVNGKVNKSALPVPEFVQQDSYVAPRSLLEKDLCQVWQQVLKLPQVGVNDNFFRIGGNSISAIRLVAGCKKTLNLELPIALVFEHKTVTELAKHLSHQTPSQMLPVIAKSNSNYPVLSFAQEQLLFIERFEQGVDAYHIPYLVQLHDGVKPDMLEGVINEVIARHPVIKTVFRQHDGVDYQHILDSSVSMTKVDLASEQALYAEVQLQISQPFDLTKEPSIRLCHYQLDDKSYLFMLWHHIAFDGWSVQIFMNELANFYQANQNQTQLTLPEQTINYLDYAAWQRDLLQGETLEKLQEYWQVQLADHETLALPTDFARPSNRDYRGKDVEFTLDANLSSKLRTLAIEQETTLYTLLLSGFYATLALSTGQSDIIVGAPSENREQAQTQEIIGFFVNSLALRVNVEAEQSIEDFIAQVHQVVTQAKVHQALPFEKLSQLLNVKADTSRHPIYQVMFDMEDFTGSLQSNTELPFDPVNLIAEKGLHRPAKFDLCLFVIDAEEQLTASLNYATSLFKQETIERFGSLYERVLQFFVEKPQQSLAKIEALSPAEQELVLNSWNQNDAAYPQDKTLPQCFEQQVEKTPHQVAVVFEGEQLTYAELNTRANKLALELNNSYQQQYNKAIQADTLIALYFDRSIEMIVSILAVLKVGAAYVPISPEYPKARAHFILKDTQTPFVLTQQRHTATLDGWITEINVQALILVTDQSSQAKGRVSTESYVNPKGVSAPEDLAYVIYTSGTTGQPKGVMISQQNVMHYLTAIKSRMGEHFNHVDFSSNYCFDLSVTTNLCPLLTGATIHIYADKLANVSAYLEHLNNSSIDFVKTTPSLANLLVSELKSQPDSALNLKTILLGGEALSQQCIDDLSTYVDNIFDEYGPTESTVGATLAKVGTSEQKHIGKAYPNIKLYNLSSTLSPVPVGAAGELYIAGAGLARGYLNQIELTNERFITNPFASLEDTKNGYTRLYKTGDLVRWLADGNLEYLGRCDQQVKIRGYRIELGEIENAINLLPSVKQSAVIDVEQQGKKFLAAYVILEAETSCSKQLFTEALADVLPEYMIPQSFVSLDEIPLTINGKLDRDALPEPVFSNDDSYVSPRNDLEEKLCDIWQQVLGLEQVGIHDNFFQVGGDSIISIQLVSKLRQDDFTLQVKDIFDAPTVAKLAEVLADNTDTNVIEAEQNILQGEFNLLPIQQNFFDKELSNPLSNPHHWNQAFMVSIPADITETEIQQAIVQLAEQHDILRAYFTKTDTGIRQGYLGNTDDCVKPLKVQDINLVSETQLQQVLTDWQNSFHCFEGPLWQAGLLTGYADNSARVFFAAHHLIIDAVSWRIIADDIQQLLTDNKLAKKSSSYRQWVNCINDYAQQHDDEVSYWQDVTSSMASNKTSLPKAEAYSFQEIQFSQALTENLLHHANQGYHTEINDLLLSSLTLALTETFEASNHQIILEGHGREQIDTNIDVSHTLGWFTTLYPVQLNAQENVAETIVNTKEMLRAIPNKGIGYGAFYQQGKLEGELPLVSFNYLGQFDNNPAQENSAQKNNAQEKNGQRKAPTPQLWQLITEHCGKLGMEENESNLLLDINGAIVNNQLLFKLGARLSNKQTDIFIQSFTSSLENVVKQAQSAAENGGTKTPSDYAASELSIARLNDLQTRYQIEAIYPATSLQQGFIYHQLSQPDDEAYRVQFLMDYKTALNVEIFQQAWQLTSLKYPALRTAFDWNGSLVQIATADASINQEAFEFHDLSALCVEARAETITKLQKEHRSREFDLNQPAPIRFIIFKQHQQLFTVLQTQHHIISDGWSSPLVLQSIHDNYNALLRGVTPEVIVDSAYLETQQYYLAQQHAIDNYWQEAKQQFGRTNDLSPLFNKQLDLDQIKVVEQPRESTYCLQGTPYHALKSMCQQQGVTLNVALQFAWHKLVQTYTLAEQTIAGTTVSGRDMPVAGINESVGLYISTLPLCVNWSEVTSVETILANIQSTIADLNTYSSVALSSLQQESKRLFHSLVVFENYPMPLDSELQTGIEGTFEYKEAVENVDFPLSIMAYEHDDSLFITLKYGQELLDESQAQRLLTQLQQIFLDISQDPSMPHQAIKVIDEQERNKLVNQWSQTHTRSLQDKTIAQLFEEQVAQSAEQVALVCAEQQITYQELNDKVNVLANVIRQKYLQKNQQALTADTLIALYFDPSIEMIVSMLAILKAGGAYVPVAPQYPKARTQFILQDSKAAFILTQAKHASVLADWTADIAAGAELLILDEALNVQLNDKQKDQAIDSTNNTSNATANVKSINSPEDLAYVIYTSGTTGQPKGVMISQQNVAHYLNALELTVGEKLNNVDFSSNYCFDLSVTTNLCPLLTGATIYIYNDSLTNITNYVEHLAAYPIDFIKTTPSLANLLADELKSHPEKDINIDSMFLGGEALSEQCIEALSGFVDNIYDEYGPTETTVGAMINKVELGQQRHIGKAYPNIKLYNLTSALEPVAVGIPGELYIAGAGLARGYLNSEELSSERFIDNPFASSEDKSNGYDRLYKTGDLVRWLADGNLEYLGRTDQQVKIRGYRIELGEIESAITRLENVKQSVVIDIEKEGKKSLAAYLVLESSASLSTEEISTALSKELPEYMLPQSFTYISEIPLTVNGKLDRQALLELEIKSDNTFVAPRDALEEQLCDIWQDLLGIEVVGIDDNFFQIGGDSIVSIQLVAKLRKKDFQLQVKTIFDAPTVAKLAKVLRDSSNAIAIDAEQELLTGEFELLPIQQWFFDQSFVKPDHWNQAFTVTIPAITSEIAIEQMLVKLTEQHDVLRTQFISSDDKVQQCYSNDLTACINPLKVQDVSQLSDDEINHLLTQWQNTFNCFEGPLWQVGLLTGYEDNTARLFFAAHHLIIDTVSWRILAEDIEQLLTGKKLAKKTSSYRQWVNTVRNYAETHSSEVKYWDNATENIPKLAAPKALHWNKLSISTKLTERLLQQSNQAYHTEINDLLLSALAVALKDTFLQSDNHIIMEGHGRETIDEKIDTSHTVGWFTTVYPVRLNVEDNLVDTIVGTKEVLRTIPNKGIGYSALLQQGKIKGGQPLVSFNYLGQFNNNSVQEGSPKALWQLITDNSGEMSASENTSPLLLNINAMVLGSQLYVDFGSQLMPEQTNACLKSFETALENIIEHTYALIDQGGTKTPSDYDIKGLSVERLRDLQSRYQIEAIYPATSLQQGFIYHQITQPDDDAYRVQLLLDYHDALDIEKYQQAWKLASMQYPVLRTAFDWQGDMLQITTVEPSISSDNFQFYDLSTLSKTDREQEIEKLQKQDRLIPFDLSKPGLIRFAIIKQSESLFTVMKTEHHSIADGWSAPILFQAVHQYYNDLLKGGKPKVIAEKAYLATQQYYLQQQDASDKYWQNAKQAYGSVNDLNTLLSKPVDLDKIKAVEKPSDQSFVLQGASYQALKNMCQQQSITLNVAMQFTWHKLIQIYTLDEQTIVGTTVSGRDVPIEGVDESVGLYINTLPLAVNWPETESIAVMLSTIQQSIAKLNTHCSVSLANLQQHGERLFHSLFVFENYPMPVDDESGESLIHQGNSKQPIEHAVSFRQSVEQVNYPFSITSYERGDSLVLKLSYGQDLLSDKQAQRLLVQMQQILNDMSCQPNMPHDAIQIINDEERNKLVNLWNNTGAAYSKDKTLQQLFEQQVAKTPDQHALIFDDIRLTYNELNDKVNQLANIIRAQYSELHGQPIQPDTFIALYFDRSIDMVVSMLAVLKSGGAYVPVSPEYPKARTQFILQDAGISLILTQQKYSSTLTPWLDELPLVASLITTDDITANQSNNAELTNLKSISSADDLAYVIYTSGTTGQPKGVMISQQNVAHYLKALELTVGDELNNVDFSSNYCFDLSVTTSLCPLLKGGTIYIYSDELTNISAYVEHLSTKPIDFVKTTPSYAKLLAAELTLRAEKQVNINTMFLGGEALTEQCIEALSSHVDNIYDEYGPTETTVGAMLTKVNLGEQRHIGKAYPNIKLYNLSSTLEPVPIGALGELYIAGAGLARGYLNRPELTDKHFIDNPFAGNDQQASDHSRLYKTGDLVRWLDSGNLEYLGRCDQQVKIRGYRIELGEIENVINRLENVVQSAVIDIEQQGNKSLAAYLVSDSGDEMTHSQLSAALAEKLPDYMVPQSFTFIDKIPLTINGKLDRATLPEPEFSSSETYEAPKNELENKLCLIWQHALELEDIGVNDNFFSLGGTSISTIKLSSFGASIGLNVTYLDITKYPTIRQLSDYLQTTNMENLSALSEKSLIEHLLQSEDFKRVTTIAPKNSNQNQVGTDLFLIPAGGWALQTFTPLLEKVDINSPIHLLDNIKNYSGRPLKVVNLVDYYFSVIRSVKPHGPYAIGGYCLGALISHEVAKRLIDIGEEVEMLYLIDPIILQLDKDILKQIKADKRMLDDDFEALDSVREFVSTVEYCQSLTPYTGEAVFFECDNFDPKALSPEDFSFVVEYIDIQQVYRDTFTLSKNGYRHNNVLPNSRQVHLGVEHDSIMANDGALQKISAEINRSST